MITAWQIEGAKVEVVTDFLFFGSKITGNGDCSHEIRRRLLLGRKAMANIDSVLKIRDSKGTFHGNTCSVKDRNGMDLTEAEEIKKRWQEYTEELYKNDFMTQITRARHPGM